MAKVMIRSRNASEGDRLFHEADKKAKQGDQRTAFRLFMLGAKLGDRSCQLNVGYRYDCGIGVHRNKKAAILWYMRAYRRGDASAANNIGTIGATEAK